MARKSVTVAVKRLPSESEKEMQCKSNGGDKEDEEDTGSDRTRSGRLNKQAMQQEG